MNKTIAILSSIGAVIFIGVIIFFIAVGYSNMEIDIRTQCDAQQQANQAVKDKTWKVVKQKAGVVDKYADEIEQ